MKNSLAILILVVLTGRTFGQSKVDDGFVDWLMYNGLASDFYSYCNTLSEVTSADTTHYYWAKYYLYTIDASGFYSAFTQSRTLCEQDTMLMNGGAQMMLTQKASLSQQWFSTIDADSISYYCGEMTKVYTWAMCERRDSVPAYFPEVMKDAAQQLVEIDTKKKWGIIWRNVVFPGWGRAYLGRKRSGASSAVNAAGLAISSFEVVRHLGVKHPFSIVNMSGFVLLYVSELSGGLRELRLIKTERKNQFLIDAAHYYRTRMDHF